MALFSQIINKVIGLENNIFSYNYDNTDKIDGIHKIFFYNLYNNHITKTYKNKFEFLKDTINNFYFLYNSKKSEEVFMLFSKIQKTYHTITRFFYLYKYKKSKITVDTDLQLNNIKEGDTNVICIYHVNSKYLFKIEEIIKIIYTALTNCFSFFSEPLSIKNPYNNIPFGKSILYYIYFYITLNAKIAYIKHDHLDLFFKFKECNFNMTKFLNNYEYLLREYSIKNYLNNLTKRAIKDHIMSMIKIFNSKINNDYNKIDISDDFPEDDLIRIMRPYLYLKLVSNFSLIHKNKQDARKKLNIKLTQFQKYNPMFGKKTIKFKNVYINGKFKRVKSHIEFNMKHKKFNTFEIENFMSNHLVYKYDGYEDDDDDDDDDESNVSMVTEDNQEHENILLNQSANINANTGNNNLITSNLREYQQTLVEQRVEEEMQEEVEERIEQEMNTELSEGYEQYYEYTFWNNEYEESSDDNSIS